MNGKAVRDQFGSSSRLVCAERIHMTGNTPNTAAGEPPWLTAMVAAVDAGTEALTLVRAACHPAVVNHSVRVLRYAMDLRERDGVEVGDAALLHSCLLHDLGASDLAQGWERFEVQGADLAIHLLSSHGWSPEESQPIWAAIALHTTPHIAERISPLARLVRLGVLADFGADLIDPALRQQTETHLPRADIERVLSGVVVRQALHDPRRAPAATWPAALLAAHHSGPDADSRLTGF
jgi:HD superfamily phosphohydrolase YqeK